jgi:hypothetical protein
MHRAQITKFILFQFFLSFALVYSLFTTVQNKLLLGENWYCLLISDMLIAGGAGVSSNAKSSL